jgi:hypothetical protein
MEVHAGGVKGLGVERRFALTPLATSFPKEGITPSDIIGSKAVNVAPSNPINNVRCIIPPIIF